MAWNRGDTAGFTDYTWACRSAIQKAVRRSDPAMLEETFEEIWEVDKEFILRRTLIFAGEECWPLISEVYKACQDARGYFRKGSGPKGRAIGKAMILGACRKLVMAEKCKDAAALASLAYGDYGKLQITDALMKKQIQAMIKFYHYCNGEDVEKKKHVWRILWNKAEEVGTQYAMDMVASCRHRFFMRGMPNEEWKFLAAAILVVTQYNEMPKLKLAKGMNFQTPPRRSKKFPYYVYDQHTRVGKRALRKAADLLGVSYDRLAMLWFNKEAATIIPQRKGEVWWNLRQAQVGAMVSEDKWERARDVVKGRIEKILREKA